MTRPDRLEQIAIVGGTGPQGRGLAARWSRAGYTVHVGSRSRERAEDVAARVRTRAGDDVDVRGATNLEVCARSEIVVVTLPYEAQRPTLPDLRAVVAGKLVCSVVNPMVFDEVGPKAMRVEAGSAAEECQELLPGARVVSAFQSVPAKRLWDVDHPVGCDVLICGDDPGAKHRVAHLAADIPGMWGVDCGPLRNSASIENVTPVLLFVNRRYRVHAGLRIDGIERDESTLHPPGSSDGARGGREPGG
ncbi:MAG TPA: NADPH-dependent F420 reductase [Nitriliruptorales bacterium]|nr:NADPH-dependent F420 reductase [Nitriliruptorales bacterium]